jgi:general secretion pathway protein L
MTTLRILLATQLSADQPAHWALYDAAAACVATGRGTASDWPPADRLEIVVAASQVRLAAVMLPPLPPERVAAAAAFALEDQLAGPVDEQLLGASPQRPDGRVVVTIVARALLAGLRSRATSGPLGRLARVVAEPGLAAPGAGACWCIADDRDTGGGFVRLADGSAFAVGPRPADGALPPELVLALAREGSANTAPEQLRVDGAVSDELLARWQRETGIRFVRGKAWCWHAAPVAAFDAATDLLQGEFALTPRRPAGSNARVFVPALWLAGAAVALHIAATVGEWAWWRVEAWRTAQAWRAVAIAAGVPEADAQSPGAARTALARRYTQQRHAQGLPAPDDALPLLARAAPALAGLPPGILKSALYADGHWTLDLQPVDSAAIGALDARLKQAGTPALVATTASGTRLRLGAN